MTVLDEERDSYKREVGAHIVISSTWEGIRSAEVDTSVSHGEVSKLLSNSVSNESPEPGHESCVCAAKNEMYRCRAHTSSHTLPVPLQEALAAYTITADYAAASASSR